VLTNSSQHTTHDTVNILFTYWLTSVHISTRHWLCVCRFTRSVVKTLAFSLFWGVKQTKLWQYFDVLTPVKDVLFPWCLHLTTATYICASYSTRYLLTWCTYLNEMLNYLLYSNFQRTQTIFSSSTDNLTGISLFTMILMIDFHRQCYRYFTMHHVSHNGGYTVYEITSSCVKLPLSNSNSASICNRNIKYKYFCYRYWHYCYVR